MNICCIRASIFRASEHIYPMAIVHFTPSVTHTRGSSARKTVLKKTRTRVSPKNCIACSWEEAENVSTTRSLKTCIALHVIRPPNCDPRKDVLLCSGIASQAHALQACLLHVSRHVLHHQLRRVGFCIRSFWGAKSKATPLQNAFGLTFFFPRGISFV